MQHLNLLPESITCRLKLVIGKRFEFRVQGLMHRLIYHDINELRVKTTSVNVFEDFGNLERKS